MTPGHYTEDCALLRAQLKCLSLQTSRDFDVWLFDPHYHKRSSAVAELATRFRLDLKHIPYTPATHVAKLYDWASMNAGYCYSRAPRNVRLSCWRFVRPTFVERILSAPPNVNVDLYMHAVGPDIYEEHLSQGDKIAHKRVWWFNGEDVNWSAIPTRSAFPDNTCRHDTADPAHSLGNWPPYMDSDAPTPAPIPLTLYGNIAWCRDQWLALNGVNEVITNAAHWEDLDFDTRAANANQRVVRYAHQIYRLHHVYGEGAMRTNYPPDVSPTRPCPTCVNMYTHNGSDNNFGIMVRARLRSGELRHYYQHRVWVCNECLLSGPLYDDTGLDHYFFHLQDMKITRAPTLPYERIGRNLSIVCEMLDRCPYLDTKVEIYNDSWTNPYYFQP